MDELERPLPVGWEDSTTAKAWETPRSKSYEGPSGGAPEGPSTKVLDACRESNLVTLFLFFLPVSFLEVIAREAVQWSNEED